MSTTPTPARQPITRAGGIWSHDGDSLDDGWLDDAERAHLTAHLTHAESPAVHAMAGEAWAAVIDLHARRCYAARIGPLMAARLAHWSAPLTAGSTTRQGHVHRAHWLEDVGLPDLRTELHACLTVGAAHPDCVDLPALVPLDAAGPAVLWGAAHRRFLSAYAEREWPRHFALLRHWGLLRDRALAAGGDADAAAVSPARAAVAPADRAAARRALVGSDPAADYAADAARPLSELLAELGPTAIGDARALAEERLERAAAGAVMRLRGAHSLWGLFAAAPAAGEAAVLAAAASGRTAIAAATDAAGARTAADTAIAAIEGE